MKFLNLYQKYAIMLFLSCICFTISFLICLHLLVEVKTLVSICSIFLFCIIFSFTGFHFSYETYLNSLKEKNLNKNKVKQNHCVNKANLNNKVKYIEKIIA